MFRLVMRGHEDEVGRRWARAWSMASLLLPPVYFAVRRSRVGFAVNAALVLLAIICAMVGKPWQNAIGFAYVHALGAAVLHGFYW